ncbi:helix-turn-helix domain-containing protein [Microbacterium sp.]|uniref:helix-turn-helix domain-containing protein n=1 Tax=Microbacterium sp. TaxID=51671 RepID=UPI003F72A99C
MATESSVQRVVEDLRVEIFRQRKSQEEIAAAAGMSQSAVSRRLNGDVVPTLEELSRIADAAGFEIKVDLVERAA